MRQVQLHEEESLLTDLASHAEAGETVTLLRGDRPVAQIIPFPEPVADDDGVAAMRRLQALMNQGLDLGGVWNGRDEIYDRD